VEDELRRSVDASWIGKVMEFAFLERTAESYRNPFCLRPRPDKQPADCCWQG
jgi:hypothetical protein